MIDEGEVRRFVELLPDLEEGRGFLLFLIARGRYIKEYMGVKGRDIVLERVLIPWDDDWRERLVRKVRKLDVLKENAARIYLFNDIPMDPRALVISIVYNPTKIKSAYIDLIRETMQTAILEQDWRRISKLHVLWFGSLHRRAKGRFHRIDVDTKDPDVLFEIEEHLEKYCFWFLQIETRRGVHYIVDTSRMDHRGFFGEFRSKVFPEIRKRLVDEHNNPLLDYSSNPLEPVPGTYYGGFKVRIVRVFERGE